MTGEGLIDVDIVEFCQSVKSVHRCRDIWLQLILITQIVSLQKDVLIGSPIQDELEQLGEVEEQIDNLDADDSADLNALREIEVLPCELLSSCL